MNRMLACLIPVALAGAAALADQPSRPDMSGKWQIDTSQSRCHATPPSDMVWTIEEKDDGTIHFIENSSAKQGKADFACGTRGQDCEVKEEGKPVKVSFWYNGPLLVETESRGRNAESIVKKRMKLSPDGATMTVEIEHLVPAAETEVLVLRKMN